MPETADTLTGRLGEMFESDADRFFDIPAGVELFERPMVGVARASDPLFAQLKEVIGEFHWTPAEALARADGTAEARSVICWVLPVARQARQANRTQQERPSREWARVRTFGEQVNDRLRRKMVTWLKGLGHAASAPAVDPGNRIRRDDRAGFASQWSERHAAFVAGLGTFGLHGSLITPKGCAHRLGSVVTSLAIEATPRAYGDDPFAWCLREAKGTCGACIDRCPAGSVGRRPEARDKDACRRHAVERIGDWGRGEFGWDGVYGCGLCMTGVPCEESCPVAPQG
jgi:epoxyqueuosine reductase QueG